MYHTIQLGFVIFLQYSIIHSASFNNEPTAKNTTIHNNCSELHDCGGKNGSIGGVGVSGGGGGGGENNKSVGNRFPMGEDFVESGGNSTSEKSTEEIEESDEYEYIVDEGTGIRNNETMEIDIKIIKVAGDKGMKGSSNRSSEVTKEMILKKMKETYFECLQDCDQRLKEHPDDKELKKVLGFEGDKCIDVCDWTLHLENWAWGVLTVREHVCGPNQRLDRNGNCRDRPIKS